MAQPENQVEKIQNQFTRQADAYSRMQQTRDEKSLRALVGLAGVRDTDQAVDIACGPGFLTMAFAEKCQHVLGVDATSELLNLARRETQERKINNLSFVLGDVNHLMLKSDRFDYASCRAAFHHFSDPATVLREMQRIIKPGGKILIADMLTSEDPEQASYHDRIEKLCDPTHTQALTASEFDQLFGDAGLNVVHRITSQMHYDVEEWLLHGGPNEEVAQEIRNLLEASLDRDLCGLNVRREGAVLKFSHNVAVFLLQKPAT